MNLSGYRKLAAAICRDAINACDKECIESEWFSDLLWFCEGQQFKRKCNDIFFELIPFSEACHMTTCSSRMLSEAIDMANVCHIKLNKKKYICRADFPRVKEQCDYLLLREKARKNAENYGK